LDRQACDITARASKAVDERIANWVSRRGEHDRDHRCHLLGGHDVWGRMRHNDINLRCPNCVAPAPAGRTADTGRNGAPPGPRSGLLSSVVRFAPEALIRGTVAGAARWNRHRLRKTCGLPYNKAAAAL